MPLAAVSNPLCASSAIDARPRSKGSAEHRSAGADGFGLNDQIAAAIPRSFTISAIPVVTISQPSAQRVIQIGGSAFRRCTHSLRFGKGSIAGKTDDRLPPQRESFGRSRVAANLSGDTNPRNPSSRSNHVRDRPGQTPAKTERQIPEIGKKCDEFARNRRTAKKVS